MKTLKEIQKYNREKIFIACNPELEIYEDVLFFDNQPFQDETTLDEILRALPILDLHNEKELLYAKIFHQKGGMEDLEEISFVLDLKKPTLEQQSEKTQRDINKLLQ